MTDARCLQKSCWAVLVVHASISARLNGLQPFRCSADCTDAAWENHTCVESKASLGMTQPLASVATNAFLSTLAGIDLANS